jgi:hypothetical protein
LFLNAGMASAATLTANPSSANAGATIRLDGSAFTPGGYPGIVLWDGREVERFFIPIDGTFFHDFVLPADAAVGAHSVAVCAAALGTTCAAGDLAQRASAGVVVAGPAAPLASFDILPRAVEVTQGLRTAIPSRTDRDGTFTAVDPFEHVPGRRTVVRVHPRLVVVDALPVGTIPPVTATLIGLDSFGAFLPGSPLSPVNSSVRADPEWTLDDTRRNPDRSWNFLLPETWTAEGDIRLLALVNPLGSAHQPECKDCGANNALDIAVSFRQVQTQDVELKIYATELFWRDAAGKPRSLAPSSADIARTVGWWLRATPIDPRRLRMSWRWGNMAWDYSAGTIVKPAIPGVPDALTFQADVTSESAGATQNYTVLPILMSHRSHPNPPPSGALFTPLVGCSGGAAIGGPPASLTSGTCGPTLAQEATHALGFNHACNAVPCVHGDELGGGFDPGYPNGHGAVEDDAFGFDTSTMVALPPERFDNQAHDFMSYGGNGLNPYNIFGPTWVSMYTWQNIIGAYRSVPAPTSTAAVSARAAAPSGGGASAGGPYLELAGRILADDSVELRPAFFVTLPESAPAPADDPEGDYFLKLYGPGRRLLYVRRFEPRPHTAHGFADVGFPAAVFHELIPALSGVRRIAVFHDDEELAARDVSGAAPSIGILRPAGATKWPSEGEEVVAWSASDPDGGPLSYRLEASRDGVSWRLLAAGAEETQATLDLSKLPMGKGDWRLRVQVSDGFNVGADEAGPVSLEARPPVALIVTPGDGEVVRSGAGVELFGLASDLQQPALPEQALTWLLDGKVVGTGRRVVLPAVSPGKHVADLRVATPDGPTGNMAVAFFVEDAHTDPNTDTDEDGLVDIAEWMEFGTLPLVRDTDQDLLDDGFEVQLGADPADSDTDGDGIPDGREFSTGSDPGQPDQDQDGDQVADSVDNCRQVSNPDQADLDGDVLGDACDPDTDGDGVDNAVDTCGLTSAGTTVDASGCSIDELCPCSGPSGGQDAWRSHGDYVSCVAQRGQRFRSLGLIDQRELAELVREAAQSRCGG